MKQLSTERKMINDIGRLIAVPSISGDGAMSERALDEVIGIARELGLEGRKLVDGKVGLIEVGHGEETLGIIGHIDVVDPGDMKQWQSNPFVMDIRNNKIFGRGAMDDKGPVIASLYALAAVKDAAKMYGRTCTKKVQLIIGTMEEITWDDIDEYFSKYDMPDYGFTPDGNFPICNVEKGYMDIEIAFPLEENEPDDGKLRIQCINAGTGVNVIPGRCSTLLSNGRTINSYGKAVHSSQPEKGSNAVFSMIDKLDQTGVYESQTMKILRHIYRGLGDPYGRNIGMYTENPYFQGEFTDRNVISPTMIAREGDILKLNINIRFVPGCQTSDIISSLERFIEPYDGQIVECVEQPAVLVSRKEPFLEKLAESYEEVTGEKAGFTLGYGGSYVKAMQRTVSFGPLFPWDEDTCHEENEYISIEDLIKCRDIYEATIRRIVFTEEKLVR